MRRRLNDHLIHTDTVQTRPTNTPPGMAFLEKKPIFENPLTDGGAISVNSDIGWWCSDVQFVTDRSE